MSIDETPRLTRLYNGARIVFKRPDGSGYVSDLATGDFTLVAGASNVSKRAVARVATCMRVGLYQASYGGTAEYETWFGLAATVARPAPPISHIDLDGDRFKHETPLPPRRAGRLGDDRRPDFGNFLFMLTGADGNKMSWNDVIDAIYAAEDDWTIPPITRSDLREQGWFFEDAPFAKDRRKRFEHALRKAKSDFARKLSIAMKRGRPPARRQ